MKKLHIFTSAACNYIPKVRLLFESLRRHHPEAVLHLALADLPPAGLDISQEPFDHIATPDQMGIDEWLPWSFCHAIVELATAIKPFYLARLLAREDCAKVLYLDPDTVAFSRLDDILDALDQANVVLTPHLVDAETAIDAVMDNEISCLKHGVYNLGFVGVAGTAEGRRFADWWARRCYHFCRAETFNGLFTDQKWIDLAPALFEGVNVLRSRRHNVATWNIGWRTIRTDSAGHYRVGEERLGFYHFTGFDSGAHAVMLGKYAGESPDAVRLVNWYREEIVRRAEDPLSQVPWRFSCYEDGTKIEPAHRVIYRERKDLQRAFPNPYAVGDGGGLRQWFATQGLQEFPALLDPTGGAKGLRDFVMGRVSTGFEASQEGAQSSSRAADFLWKPKAMVHKASQYHKAMGARALLGLAWQKLRKKK